MEAFAALEDWLAAGGTGSSTSGAFEAVAHLERLLARPVDALISANAEPEAVPNALTRGADFERLT
jgi:ABC-type sugar transport system substrate-binding protein